MAAGTTELRLDRKVAIVTGAGSGIGRASAVLFARAGATVVVIVHSDAAESAETTALIRAEGGSAMQLVVDVTVEREVSGAVRRTVRCCGGLDILFNNAGGGRDKPVAELSEATWQAMVDLNLKSMFFGCKHAIPELIKRGGGVILSTSSPAADVGMAGLPSYSAAKAGMIGLTRQIAVEYGRLGIRANCLCPGWIATPTLEQWMDAAPDPTKVRHDAVKSIPLGRFGRAEEVAQAALFLVSDQSSFITGTVVTIDGGYTAQ